MNNAVIVDYARSAFQPARKGGLVGMRPDELVAKIVRAIVDRSHINLDDLEDLIVGCAFPEGEQGYNIGRIAGFNGRFAKCHRRGNHQPLVWLINAIYPYGGRVYCPWCRRSFCLCRG